MHVSSHHDLHYRSVDGIDLYADVHRPEVDGPVPAVVYIHGGGLTMGDRTDFLDTRLLPMARTGIAVVAIQYRFVDVAPFPAQLLDARAAVRWVERIGPEHGLATDRIGAWGSSAGGLIAALLGLESVVGADGGLVDRPLAPFADAVVTWSSPLDLAASFHRSWLEAAEMPLHGSEVARYLGAEQFDPADRRHRSASPLHSVTGKASPFLHIWGDRDHMVDQGPTWRMHDRMTVDGVESAVLVIGGAGHEDSALDGPLGIGASSSHLINHLRRPTPPQSS